MAGLITPDIFEIKNLCKKHNIFLIEDAAHTPGSEIDKQQAGAIGDIGCFSFYPSKIITCGEGGMLTTNNNDIAEFARSYQNRGRDMSSKIEIYKQIGRNVRMPEFSALLGRVQLSHLDENLKKRREIADIYNFELSKLNTLEVIFPRDIKSSSFWKFPILLDKKFNREIIINKMHEKGIAIDSAYFPPLHLQTFFRKNYKTFDGQLQKSEELLKTHICLPCHPRMKDEDVDFVINSLKEILASFK
jgi:perosamine synthetase